MGVSKALAELRLADHMIYVTLPLLNDKRIFLNAVKHLGNALRSVIESFVRQEVSYKRLNQMPSDDFLFKNFIKNYSNRLGLTKYVKMLTSVNAFNNTRDRSSIKLKRDDKFIVISPEYSSVALSISEVKEYLGLTREFINKMEDYIK